MRSKVSAPAPESPASGDSTYDFIEMFVFAMAVILVLFSFFVRQTVVDGNSMQNTLQNGERLLISDLFYTPQSGDIVVFQSASTGRSYPLVKRVIATEGQTVRMETEGFYIDGVYLNESYVYTDFIDYTYSNRENLRIGETITVPEGCVFVLGDHRNNSADSRTFGCIETGDIIGRVILRVMPFSRFGTVH